MTMKNISIYISLYIYMIIWAPIMMPICCFLFSRAYLATCTCWFTLLLWLYFLFLAISVISPPTCILSRPSAVHVI